MSAKSVRRTLAPEERREQTETGVYLTALRRMIRAAGVEPAKTSSASRP